MKNNIITINRVQTVRVRVMSSGLGLGIRVRGRVRVRIRVRWLRLDRYGSGYAVRVGVRWYRGGVRVMWLGLGG